MKRITWHDIEGCIIVKPLHHWIAANLGEALLEACAVYLRMVNGYRHLPIKSYWCCWGCGVVYQTVWFGDEDRDDTGVNVLEQPLGWEKRMVVHYPGSEQEYEGLVVLCERCWRRSYDELYEATVKRSASWDFMHFGYGRFLENVGRRMENKSWIFLKGEDG